MMCSLKLLLDSCSTCGSSGMSSAVAPAGAAMPISSTASHRHHCTSHMTCIKHCRAVHWLAGNVVRQRLLDTVYSWAAYDAAVSTDLMPSHRTEVCMAENGHNALQH